jgi:hypothetical protein
MVSRSDPRPSTLLQATLFASRKRYNLLVDDLSLKMGTIFTIFPCVRFMTSRASVIFV